MILLALLCLSTALTGKAADALAVVQASVQQIEGGSPLPPGFTHVPGEILYYSFQIEGYKLTPDRKVSLTSKVDAFDPQGVRIVETMDTQVDTQLSYEDKDWRPKVRHTIPVPPLAPSGVYRIVATVTDNLAKTTATKEITFEVRGHDVAPSDALVIRNFHFYRSEEEREPLERAVYRPGDSVWARFDITGYKLGEGNRVDVSYGIAVLTSAGKALWSQPDAADEKAQSFYPKRFVPGSMSLNLQPNIHPGDYTIAITARDGIGGQTYETKQTFTVQ